VRQRIGGLECDRPLKTRQRSCHLLRHA
jgi:hypothetical protein